MTSLHDSLGLDKPNRYTFNNVPTATFPHFSQRRQGPGSLLHGVSSAQLRHPRLQRGSQQLCCRDGECSSQAPWPPGA